MVCWIKPSNMQNVPAILLTRWRSSGTVTAVTVLSASQCVCIKLCYQLPTPLRADSSGQRLLRLGLNRLFWGHLCRTRNGSHILRSWNLNPVSSTGGNRWCLTIHSQSPLFTVRILWPIWPISGFMRLTLTCGAIAQPKRREFAPSMFIRRFTCAVNSVEYTRRIIMKLEHSIT